MIQNASFVFALEIRFILYLYNFRCIQCYFWFLE